MIYIIQTDLKIIGGEKIQNIYINPFFYEKHNIMDEKKIPSTQRCKQWTQSSSQTIDIKERSKRKGIQIKLVNNETKKLKKNYLRSRIVLISPRNL